MSCLHLPSNTQIEIHGETVIPDLAEMSLMLKQFNKKQPGLETDENQATVILTILKQVEKFRNRSGTGIKRK